MTLDAPPGAECVLYNEASAYSSGGLSLHADDRGELRIHLRPDPTEPTRLALDCQANGVIATTTHYEVQAGAADEPPGGAAAPRTGTPLPVRPALDGDPSVATDAELAAKGFPPRPDRTKAPEAYSRWLGIVSRPAGRLVPRFVHRDARPSARTAPVPTGPLEGPTYSTTSPNWCGYALMNPRTVYWYVLGSWTVPTVTPHPGRFFEPWYFDYSSQWIGMDGLYTQDVVQAGSEQDTYTVAGTGVSNYYLWTENFPASSVSAQIDVNPGDLVDVYVWVGDSSGNPGASGGYGWYYLYNATQNTYASSGSALAAPFSGTTAEWIVEKPSEPFQPYGLANFGQSEMSYTYAFDTSWNAHTIGSDARAQVKMVNGNDALCYPYAISSTSAGFVWTGYD